ncbi:MAG: 1-(5-phosphoribosyl)-5-[(5-phosphoribosylamino)methylideneamino]imidazole-4-carboxamide isomerase [Calditrichaeota bacterium]|nr:MAG: 1-(5-phosphoribosyl)-5-[(5-phosphoribosylamino)methylideneamino]imidazole-4-carboxamide isomerase [Calditrichota bacterium]
MIIYPAIDLRGGKCVRLVQGEKKRETIYNGDPIAVARGFKQKGANWLHIVDLDRAFDEERNNTDIVKRIVSEVKINVQTGGGVRTLGDIERLLETGVQRVILGTIAVRRPALVQKAITEFGGDKVSLAIDARDGRVAVDGWERTSQLDALAFAKRMQHLGVQLAIFTDIARDGMLTGININALKLFLENTGMQIIASGGIRDLDDLKKLESLKSSTLNGAILGKSLYEKKIDLAEALDLAGKNDVS